MSSCQNKIPIIGNLLIRATGDMLANFDERQLSISVQTRERWHCTCVFVVNCITAFLKFSLVSVFPIIIYPPKWKYMFVCLLFSSTYLHTLESSSKGRNSIKYFSTIRGVLVKIYVKFNFNTLINHIACLKKNEDIKFNMF